MAWPGRVFAAYVVSLNALGSCLILFVMCVICADVIGRYFLSFPIAGTAELVAMSIIVIVFFQFAHTLQAGQVIRSGMIIDWLRDERPSIYAVVEFVWSGLGAAAFGTIAYALLAQALRDYGYGDSYGSPGVFQFPKWPIRSLAALGAATTAIQFLLTSLAALSNRPVRESREAT